MFVGFGSRRVRWWIGCIWRWRAMCRLEFGECLVGAAELRLRH